MNIGFEGGLGSGKTIGMVRYLKKDYDNGMELKLNFGMRNLDFEWLDVTKILEEKDLHNVSIGIDEITVFADCRKSTSRMNRLISYFILQSRKRDVNVYFTTQSFSYVDFRLMNHTHFQILCEKIFDRDGKEIDGVRRYVIFDVRDLRNIKMHKKLIDITQYYDYYDTHEIILPPI